MTAVARLAYSEDQSRADDGKFGEGSGSSGDRGKSNVPLKEAMADPKQFVGKTVVMSNVKHGGETDSVRMDVHAASRLGEMTLSPGMKGAGVRFTGVLKEDAFDAKAGDEWVQAVYSGSIKIEGTFQAAVDDRPAILAAAIAVAGDYGLDLVDGQLRTADGLTFSAGVFVTMVHARLAYVEDQQRDDHGRFGEGSSTGDAPIIEGHSKTAELVTMSSLPAPVQAKVLGKITGPVAPPKVKGEPATPPPEGGWGLGTTPEAVRENFEAMYERAAADPESREEGMNWYGDTHDQAAQLGEQYGYDMEQTAGCLAAMSAGTKWDTEMPIMETMMKMDGTDIDLPVERLDVVNAKLEAMHEDPVENGMNIRDLESARAIQVMHEEHMTNGPGDWGAKYSYNQYERSLEVLRGDTLPEELNGVKIREFYNNIASPGVEGHVTIDVMMMRIAANNPTAENDTRITGSPAYKTVSLGPTPFLADEVRRIADNAGILPHQAQAMMWVQWQKEQAAARAA